MTKLYAADADKIKTLLEAFCPYVSVEFSTLGGEDRASILIKISLDPKDEWINGILHNSRFSMFSYNCDNKVEQFARHHNLSKFRKSTVKSIDAVVDKIKQWADKQ